MAHGKMKSVYGIYKKHGRDQFLDAAGYYSCHVHPESIDKTIDEMESRWYDATHRQTEAEKMVEDYNNGLTVLNDASLACVDTGFGMTICGICFKLGLQVDHSLRDVVER